MVEAGGVSKGSRRHGKQQQGEQNAVGNAAKEDKIFYFREEPPPSTHTALAEFLEFLAFTVFGFDVLIGAIVGVGIRARILRHEGACWLQFKNPFPIVSQSANRANRSIEINHFYMRSSEG